MRRIGTGALLALCVAALASQALAHGGTYQPPRPGPSEPPPPPAPPPPPPNVGDGGGPATPSGGDTGPSTPGGGPAPTAPGSGGGPATPGGGGTGPATPGDGPAKGPATGGGGPSGAGPATPGGAGPSGPESGSGGGPKSGKPPKKRFHGGVPDDHWTHWWYANRALLTDLRGRVRDRQVTTPSDGAAHAAPQMWRAQAQQALTLVLGSADEDVATSAAIALGKNADPSDASVLIPVMLDASRQQTVRESAALGLGLLAPEKGSETVRRALESVAADDLQPERLRAFAVYAQGLRGESASLPFLLDTAHGGGASWDVAAAGTSALGLSRSGLVREDLERILGGPRRDRRREAVRRVYAAHGLARLGDPASVAALREAAADDDEDVRRASLLAIGALAAPGDTPTAELLVRVLHQDRDRACRNLAVIALGRIGSERATKELRWAYENSDSVEQPFAALAIGLLVRRNHDAEMTKALRRDLLERANPDLRGALCIACGLAGDSEAAPVLRRLAGERGDPEVRAQAAMALGLLGDREAGAPILRALLQESAAPAIQREAALALGMLADREAGRTLLDLVENGTSVFVQGSAAVALGRIGGAESAPALVAMLQDKSRSGISRGMAGVALGLLLDRSEGRTLAGIGADLDWYAVTPTVAEILDIL